MDRSGMPDEYRIREVFQSELLEGETIEWTGQPDPTVYFTKADIFLVPFSLLWGGFAVFWELMALGFLFGSSGKHGAPGFFPIFGLPFVAMGLYFIFGRFIYKAAKKRRTYYAVTNKRILIVIGGGRNNNVQATYIHDIPTVNMLQGGRAGTIIFGNSTGQMASYANTGMDFFGMSQAYGTAAPAFYDIHDVDKVYQLVNRLRGAQSA